MSLNLELLHQNKISLKLCVLIALLISLFDLVFHLPSFYLTHITILIRSFDLSDAYEFGNGDLEFKQAYDNVDFNMLNLSETLTFKTLERLEV